LERGSCELHPPGAPAAAYATPVVASSAVTGAPPTAGLVELYALQDHPTSDKVWVDVRATAPGDGYVFGTWDNAKGWRSREVWCRWDWIVDGRPVDDGFSLLALDIPGATAVPASLLAAHGVAPPTAAGGEGAAGGVSAAAGAGSK